MNKRKKARLEASGWMVGTTSQFLGLSAEEASKVEIKIDRTRPLQTRRSRRKPSKG